MREPGSLTHPQGTPVEGEVVQLAGEEEGSCQSRQFRSKDLASEQLPNKGAAESFANTAFAACKAKGYGNAVPQKNLFWFVFLRQSRKNTNQKSPLLRASVQKKSAAPKQPNIAPLQIFPEHAILTHQMRGSSSVGRATPCQGVGRGFESRLPLHLNDVHGVCCLSSFFPLVFFNHMLCA